MRLCKGHLVQLILPPLIVFCGLPALKVRDPNLWWACSWEVTKAPLCATRSLCLCTPPTRLLFHDKSHLLSWHTPAAILPGCLLPGQARLPKEKNSSQRAASIFLVAVLPLNLPAEEMFCVLGFSPCCPTSFLSSIEFLLRWPGAVTSTESLFWWPGSCDARNLPQFSSVPAFCPLAYHRREQGDFLLMRLLGLLVCRFCGDV